MADPTRSLEWSPSTDPWTNPVWVAIPNSDIRSLTFTRGRERELDEFRAGTLQVVLDNRDRAYDPEFTSTVRPMKRVRYRETFSAVTYDLFEGYVDGWDQDYSKPREATATLRATDGFKVLANKDLAASVYEQEVIDDGPVIWFKLEEESGATTVTDAIAGLVGSLVGAPTLGETGLRTLPAGSAMLLDLETDFVTTSSGLSASSEFSVEFLIRTTGAPSSPQNLISQARSEADGLAHDFSITTAATGNQIYFTLGGTIVYPYGSQANVRSSVTINDGLVHHVVCRRNASNVLAVFVDGVNVTVTETSSTSNVGVRGIGGLIIGKGPAAAAESIVLDEIALYDNDLSDARIAAHNTAARTPWDDDLTGARIERILDAISWPSSLREIDTGNSTCQSSELSGTALSYLQKVQETEAGALFMGQDGKVRFISRSNRFGQASTATFGDSGSELKYAELTFDYEDQAIVNEATVSRARGTAMTADDTTSKTTYLTHSLTKDGLLHDTDAGSLNHAQFLVSQHKDPKLRITSMTIKPQRDPANLFPAVLARELGDEVRVLRRPQGVGSAIDQDLIIEGITYTVTPKTWEVRWQLSNAEDLDYWKLGVTGASELGQTTKVAF